MKRLYLLLFFSLILIAVPATALTFTNYTTNSSDGHITVTGDNQPFATLHNSASGTATTTTTAYTYPQVVSDSTSGMFYQIHRTALIFDTSGMPDDAIITSVNVSLLKYYLVTELGDVGIAVTGFTIDGALSNDDFNNFGYTPFSDYINVSDMTDNVYYNWSLNAAGISAINKTGDTGFGLLTEYDVLNSAPGWVADKSMRANFRTADNMTTIPFIEIEYTLPTPTPTAAPSTSTNSDNMLAPGILLGAAAGIIIISARREK